MAYDFILIKNRAIQSLGVSDSVLARLWAPKDWPESHFHTQKTGKN